MTDQRSEIDTKIADLEQRVDGWSAGLAWLWYEIEQRHGAEEAMNLRDTLAIAARHTVPQPEQVVRLAHAAGAEGIWLVRGASSAGITFTFADRTIDQVQLAPPHDLVVVLRFPAGDGGEAGMESR